MSDFNNIRENLLRTNLLRLAIGNWQSQVLFTAARLGIFNHIATQKDATAIDVAQVIGSHPFTTELLLNACVAMRLLTRNGNYYQNAEIAHRYLVYSSEEYLGDWVMLLGDWARPWLNLENSIWSGQPVENPFEHLGGDISYTEHFILAMHQYALVFGESFVNSVDLAEAKSILDVGGGAGTYAILLARKYSNLRGLIFDLPSVTTITSRIIAEYGLTERLKVVEGNYHRDQLPGPVDAVLLSNVVQQENPDECRHLLLKVHKALVPNGKLILQGMFLEETRTEPLWATLHSLTMLLVAGGRAYTFGEIESMLYESGFSHVELFKPPLFNAESFFIAKP